MNSPKADRPNDARDDLASGEAWSAFCRELDELGQEILRPTAPKAPVDIAEGYRYLTRMLRSSFELIMESGDAAKPALTVSLHETMKLGWDNPDNLHLNAYIADAFEYKLSGLRGDAHTVSIAIYGGSYGKNEKGRSTVAFADLSDFETGPNGEFEIALSVREQPGNWIPLQPGATTLMIRQTFWNKQTDSHGRYELTRTDTADPPPALDPAFVTAALRRTTRYIKGSNRLFFDFSEEFQRDAFNGFKGSDPVRMGTNQGIPYNQLSSGWWRIEDDQAAVIDFMPPPECPYWMFVLSNYWGESFDYTHHRIHTNNRQAPVRDDGTIRLIVASEDPGVAEALWIDTAGHEEGVWQFRWYHLDGLPPCPDPQIVSLESLR